MTARRERFDALYSAQFGFVWALIRAQSVPPAQREDVAQEVWIKAYRKLHLLRPDASARAWLAALTRRTIQHHWRGLSRADRRVRAVAQVCDDVTNPHLRFERCQLADAVLSTLNEEQRVAFVLVHGQGMSGAEAARALDISVNTLYSRLRLAQRHLERRGIENAEALTQSYRDDAQGRRARDKICAAVALLVPPSSGIRVGAQPVAPASSPLPLVGVLWGAAAAVVLLVGWGGASSPPEAFSTTPVGALARSSVAVAAPQTVPRVDPRDLAWRADPSLPQPEPDVNASEPASTPARLAGRSSKDATARPVENATVSAEVEPARDAPAAAAEPLGEGPVIPAAPPPMAMDPQSLAAADEIASLVERRQAEERQRTMAWARRARPAPGSNETASLSEETALLRQAKVQLDAGDAPAALRLLRKHARAFRDGSMVDVAAGLRVAALCEAGRDRQARQAARALARRAPDSPLTAEVPRRCR